MRADLIERARHGDREAFGRLAAIEVGRLLAVARLILRDADQAEDAVQETLLRCWRQLPNLRDVDRFDAWLHRILVRASVDESRRHRRFVADVGQIAGGGTAPDAADAVADREQLDRGFRRLSVDHRAIVVLHHYADLPMPEVAAILGIPVGTAKSRHHYAMSALRAALEADARASAGREALA
jgi:RNA polymerase sigma-70 factor (ECF subfamily)